MKLRKVRVREFRSIWDSNTFEVDKVTCLVGKNEAGKTALLQALYRLNPIVDDEGNFDVTHDYPRSEVENYQQEIEKESRDHAVVVEATFELESPELDAIREEYGANVLERDEVVVSKGYDSDDSGTCTRIVRVPVAEQALVKNLIESAKLPKPLATQAKKKSTLAELSEYLIETGKKRDKEFTAAQAAAKQLEDGAEKTDALEKSKTRAESQQAKTLRARLTGLLKHRSLTVHFWQRFLKQHLPKFLYFDQYYQMRGRANIGALKKRRDENTLEFPDRPLLGLIELARLDLDKLLASTRTQELKNKLEGASNYLSGKILDYWSQNKHLRMKFDVRRAMPDDPIGMTEGTNIWGEVEDSKHLVSTGIGTRSAGFVWFFSFLAWYSAETNKGEPLVLLLDEPGHSLHGRAQEDLLRYFEAEVATNPKHQLLYTTHSPFMVDSHHFDRVRIVQDKGIDANGRLPRKEDGTKVFTDVLEAGPDSLFPLQGALGYDIYQTLFIGPNSLVVEGVSDLLYLQTISGVLQSKGRAGLDRRWTITPVGGADKVPTFVALIGSQKNLNIATLIDFQKSHGQMIENLYKKKLRNSSATCNGSSYTNVKIGKLARSRLRWYVIAYGATDGENAEGDHRRRDAWRSR